MANPNFDIDKTLVAIAKYFTGLNPKHVADAEQQTAEALSNLEQFKAEDATEDAAYEKTIEDLKAENAALLATIDSYQTKLQAILDEFDITVDDTTEPA